MKVYGGAPWPVKGARLRLPSRLYRIAAVALMFVVASLVPVASASSEGSISGTVILFDGGTIGDLCIDVFASEDLSLATSEYHGFTGSLSYTIAHLQDGDYRLLFTDCTQPTRTYAFTWWGEASDFDSAATIRIQGGSAATGIDVTLQAGAAIEGRITTHDGDPFEACVTPLGISAKYYVSTKSDPGTGRYRLTGLATRSYPILFVDCRWPTVYESAYYPGVQDPSGAVAVEASEGTTTSGIDVALWRAASIVGRVTGIAGGPIEGICAEAHPADGGWWESKTETLPDGSYEITGLDGGDYHVFFRECTEDREFWFRAEWYDNEQQREEAAVLSVPPRSKIAGTDAVLRAPGGISGRVAGGDGAPLRACVRVEDSSWFTTSGSDGSFRFDRLDAGTYVIVFRDCSGGGGRTEWFDNAPKRSLAQHVVVQDSQMVAGVDAVLEADSTVSGKVDLVGPPSGASACLHATDASGEEVAETFTTGDGSFTFRGLWAGDYRIRIDGCSNDLFVPEWYRDAETLEEAQLISLGDDEDLTDVEAEVLAYANIEGQVRRSFTGFPLQGMCVELQDTSGDALEEVVSDGEGRFHFDRKPPGHYRVHVGNGCGSSVEYIPKSVDVTAPGGLTSEVNVGLQWYSRLSGRVQDHLGRPLPAACVELFKADGSPVDSTVTDDIGDFSFRIIAGQHKLRFAPCDGAGFQAEWYKDKTDLATATTVSVMAEDLVRLQDIRVQGADLITLPAASPKDPPIDEGATSSYQVVLLAPPAAEVAVDIVTDGEAEVSPSSLTFTPENWQQPQDVQVLAVDDSIMEEHIVHEAQIRHVASGDPFYEGVERDRRVRIRDDDWLPEVEYLGPSSGVRGDTITVSAQLRRRDGSPLAGRPLRFSSGAFGDWQWTTTDDDGRAQASVQLEGGFGQHTVTVHSPFQSDPEYLPATETQAPFEVRWEYVFADKTDPSRVLQVNPNTKEIRFIAPDDVSFVYIDQDMRDEQLPSGDRYLEVSYEDLNLIVRGEFLPERDSFAAFVRTPRGPYVLHGRP